MKRHTYLLIIITLALGLISCGNEDERFEDIEFDATGVTLTKPDGGNYLAEIGPEGGIITLTAKGKNAGNGFLSIVRTGDFFYEVTPEVLRHDKPYTICDEKWGRIELLSDSPYTVKILLNPNKTGHRIDYELTFGCCYRISTILLTQQK